MTPAAAPAAAGSVLALQRAAGNRAVGSLLGRRRLARDPKLPANPTKLADYGTALGGLVFDTDTVSLDVRASMKFKGRFPLRSGVNATFHLGAGIVSDKAKQDTVETGLSNLAAGVFNLTDGTTEAVRTNMVHLHDLYLKDYGAQDGRYRFTAVKGEKAGDIDVLIEYAGPPVQEIKSWDHLKPDERTQLEARFTRFGFTWGDGDVGWALDKKALVLQVLALLPDAVLNELSGVTFQRKRAEHGPTGEDGYYDGNSRTITFYTHAFDSDRHATLLVLHELGHAFGFRPQERKHTDKTRDQDPDYRKDAGGALGKAVTVYGRKDWSEDFAEDFAVYWAEPDLLKALRPDVASRIKAMVAALPAAPANAKP